MKMDDSITNYTMTHFDIFENIHPNVITSVGLLCNYFILLNIDNIETQKINEFTFLLLIAVRFLADCLDGAVARKYKRTSKLGNILDTISDLMFMLIAFYLAMIIFKLPNWTIIFYIIILVFFNEKYDILRQHSLVKNGGDSIIDQASQLLADNTIVSFGVFYIVSLWFNRQQVSH